MRRSITSINTWEHRRKRRRNSRRRRHREVEERHRRSGKEEEKAMEEWGHVEIFLSSWPDVSTLTGAIICSWKADADLEEREPLLDSLQQQVQQVALT